jgi:hypothetical protein
MDRDRLKAFDPRLAPNAGTAAAIQLDLRESLILQFSEAFFFPRELLVQDVRELIWT